MDRKGPMDIFLLHHIRKKVAFFFLNTRVCNPFGPTTFTSANVIVMLTPTNNFGSAFFYEGAYLNDIPKSYSNIASECKRTNKNATIS